MNPDYEKRLEAEIQRQLEGLPDLPAPVTLATRVMSRVGARLSLPWYRRPWPLWPTPMQAVLLILLLGLFGGLCFASWKLMQADSLTASLHRLGGWFSAFGALWGAFTALLGAIVIVIKQLGTGFIIGCLVAIGLGYALCLGLGSFCVRLALARRWEPDL